MKSDTLIPLALTAEECAVLLTLAQLGVKTTTGSQFDQASASYVHLRGKIVAAEQAAAKAVNDNASAEKLDAAE